jgi:peptidyl-prolyl cis-trans isomerase SurA
MIPDTAVKNGYLTVPEKLSDNKPLFSIKGKAYDYKSFYNHIMQTSRGRLFGEKANAVKSIYPAFVEKSLMDYEEDNLAIENTEFKNLLKEYRDGIILFELTDKSVWTKASSDSVGLATFFDKNKSKYQWNAKFEGKALRCTNEKDLLEFTALLRNNSIADALAKINEKEGKVTVEEGTFEYDKIDAVAKNVKEGAYSMPVKSADGNSTIYCPTTITTTPTQKSLVDARGYVIADYQDYLEKTWIASMEATYPVKVNEAVLQSIIKK